MKQEQKHLKTNTTRLFLQTATRRHFLCTQATIKWSLDEKI